MTGSRQIIGEIMIEKLYTTDLKFIIPIIGIILAWVLTSAGNFYSSLNINRKIIGKCLVQLYFFYVEREKILSLFEILKGLDDISDYENARKRYVERYAVSEEALKDAMDSIKEVSSIYPFMGFTLKSIIESYSLKQKVSFKNAAIHDLNEYIKLVSIYETSLELENQQLKKIILKLSYKHSFITWVRMHNTFAKINKTNFNEISKKFNFLSNGITGKKPVQAK